MTVTERLPGVQPRTTSSNKDLANSPNSYLRRRVPIGNNRLQKLATRAFREVPDLPPGWRAIWDGVTTIQGIPAPSQLQIGEFYSKILDAVLEGLIQGDTVQKAFHLGNLALKFRSRGRAHPIVTPELVLATMIMLVHFAQGGFIDLFAAQLWHQVDDMKVLITLSVTDRVSEGLRIF